MNTATLTAEQHADYRRRIWAIVGSSSGNLVEWYDFYAYAFTALYFAKAFFPDGNQTTQLLQTAAVFAIGFLMRPIGGYLFGVLADKLGRKLSMMVSVLLMCAGSLAIACLPTYQSIGVAAPALFGMLIDSGSRESLFFGYLLGAALMLTAAAVAARYCIASERRPLEHVARPLAAIGDES